MSSYDRIWDLKAACLHATADNEKLIANRFSKCHGGRVSLVAISNDGSLVSRPQVMVLGRSICGMAILESSGSRYLKGTQHTWAQLLSCSPTISVTLFPHLVTAKFSYQTYPRLKHQFHWAMKTG